jgi:hypothetical protein
VLGGLQHSRGQPLDRHVLRRRVPGTGRVLVRPDHRRIHRQPPLPGDLLVSTGAQLIQDLLPSTVGRPTPMPVVHRLPIPIRTRQIPPRRPGPHPPQHPVDHGAMIGPPPSPPPRHPRQQPLQPSPVLIAQIVSIMHEPGLQHPGRFNYGTRPSARCADPFLAENSCRVCLSAVHSPIDQRAPGHCHLRCGGLRTARPTLGDAPKYRERRGAVSARCGQHPRRRRTWNRGLPTPMRLQRIMLVQAARADPVSVSHARPSAPNPSYNTGESLEDAAPRQRRRPLSAR